MTSGLDLIASTESQFAEVTGVDPTSALIGDLPVGELARSVRPIDRVICNYDFASTTPM